MAYEKVTSLPEDRAPRALAFLPELPHFALRDQLLKLKRRRGLIAGTMVAVTLLAWLMVSQIEPLYRASAYVMIEPLRQQPLEFSNVTTQLPPDLEMIQSQIAIITSRGLADKVIDKLDLDLVPEFNSDLPGAAGPGPVERVVEAVKDAGRWTLGLVGLGGESAEPDPAAVARERRTSIVNTFIDQLSASPQGRSRVIEISFASVDRERAAQVVNTVADLYILDQLESKYEATERATNWLNERLMQLREKTEASERAAELFRKQAGLLQGESGTLAAQEISQLNTELITARAVRAEAEARLRQAERVAADPDRANTAVEVLNSELIQRLREQQITLQRRYAELSENYGPKHPSIVSLRADMSDLDGRLKAEINRIIGGIRSEVSVARSREEALNNELETLKQRAGVLSQAQVQLRSLEATASADRLLLNNLQQRFNETTIQQDAQQPDARVISTAPVPQLAYYPKTKLVIVMALFGSAMLGIVLALLLENFDLGFRSSEQIDAATRLPTLGLIPHVPGTARRGTRVEDFLLDRPRSSFAEAMTGAIASLFLIHAQRRPRSVLVTSSLPDEGKSTLSINLARAAQQAGMKTLLIDADLRRPTLHSGLRHTRQPGLVELLTERASFEDVVRRDSRGGIDFIPAGGPVANPLQFLASEQTRTFIQNLGRHYDFVVIDSSPTLVVSDSRVLCRYVDQTLFVVRWAKTRREQVLLALKQLAEAGGTVGGVLLSMVNVKRHAEYGFSDSGQYQYGAKYYHG